MKKQFAIFSLLLCMYVDAADPKKPTHRRGSSASGLQLISLATSSQSQSSGGFASSWHIGKQTKENTNEARRRSSTHEGENEEERERLGNAAVKLLVESKTAFVDTSGRFTPPLLAEGDK